jgi:hypothetical protein
MDFSALHFTGSVLLLGVFSVCATLALCQFLLTTLAMIPADGT